MVPQDSRKARRTPSRGPLIAAITAVLVIVGLAGLVTWAVLASRTAAPTRMPADSFERFRPGWTAAMAKAGVEATFPPSPVNIESLRTTGSRRFDTTFTAEEITALLNVYAFDAQIGKQAISLEDISVSFPAPGIGALAGRLAADGSIYDARIEGPLHYAATGIDSPGATSLVVEGFNVKGDRRAQASEAVLAFLNTYVRAAPGLVLERAEIVEGGLAVKGSAPVRIENP